MLLGTLLLGAVTCSVTVTTTGVFPADVVVESASSEAVTKTGEAEERVIGGCE
jgi:hypothetical protein